MFNFNFDWNAISNFGNTFNPVAFEQEVAALANVATAAAVSAPAVVNTPVNVAPTPAVVQPVVQQVIQSVAPVIAPNVPPATLTKLEPIITEQIVSSPQVISSPTGATVSPKVVETIVSSVGTIASKSPEFVESITPATAPADTTKPVGTLDLSNQKAETLKATESIKTATPVPSPALAKANDYTSIEAILDDEREKAIAANARAMAEAAATATAQPVTIDTAAVRAGEEASMLPPTPTTITTPSAIAAQESGTIGAVSIANQQAAADAAASVGIVSGAESGTIGAFRTEIGIPPEKGAGTPPIPPVTPITPVTPVPPVTPVTPVIPPVITTKPAGAGDAGFAAILAQLGSIGINTQELLDAMSEIRKLYPDIESADALTLLKYDKRFNSAYTKRFAGNVARSAAGLTPLDDKEYLANEAAYRKIFNAYGLKQFANPESYARFIGTDVAPEEVGSRVSLVYNRVQNAPSDVMKALKQFYPQLSTADLMAYALDPTNQLPELQKKVQAAEIGGEYLRQGLSTSLGGATFTGAEAAPYSNVARSTIGVEAIQREGLTPAEATAAVRNVARVLPEAEKLTSIYAGRTAGYGLKEAEQQYIQGLASAERAQRQLTELEKASFQGSAGRAKTGKGSTAGML